MTSILRKHVAANRERSYCVSVVPGLSGGRVSDLVDMIGKRKCLLVTTPSVAALYAKEITKLLVHAGIDVSMIVLNCCEQSKTLDQVEQLCQECFRIGMDRTSVLVGCGGGVCTDLVTMAAALTRRGLSYIKIPTTLIGLIDAGIGIKGAVNLPRKKSAIGCFYPPDSVLLDPAFLRTLPRKLLADGLAEAIKVAVAVDAVLFRLLESGARDFLDSPLTADIAVMTDLVWRSSSRLLEHLEPNLYEDQTYQRLLDFGHTFSPMIESESEFQVSHGIAVAIDIALSSALSYELGLLSLSDLERILASLDNVELPIFSDLLTVETCTKALVEIEAHRGGQLNLVLPTGIGNAIFIEQRGQISATALSRALDLLHQRTKRSFMSRSDSVLLYPPLMERT